MQKDSFQLFAKYNQWMNEKIFAASAQLSEQELTQDKGAFFKSVLGTLNHLLVGDILWLKRFAASPQQFTSLTRIGTLENPPSLDAQLYGRLDAVLAERQRIDEELIAFCDEVTEAQLAEKLDYRNSKGERYQDPLGLLIQHLFNHQTHHRGQASTLLSQAGIEFGATDLLVCIREL